MSLPTRPRGAAIAAAWQAAGIDAPELVNRAGSPLARTTKRILDPLLIRPRMRRHLAAPVLADDEVAELTGLFTTARGVLAHASRWYAALRAERTARGIVAGDPQELYFPRAYELALEHGAPGDEAESICAEVLVEFHGDGVDPLDAVRERLTRVDEAARIRARWDAGWRTEDARSPAAGEQAAELGARIAAALTAARTSALTQLLADDGATEFGLALRETAGLVDALLAGAGVAHPRLRLGGTDPLEPPALLGRGDLPLDRTLEQRLRAAVRRLREQGAPIDPDDLLDAEADRVLHGHGLTAAEARALLTIGIVLAAALEPLAARQSPPKLAGGVAGHMQAQARKAAHVMHLRRELSAGGAIHPRQQVVVDDLAEFWRPWLTRLWVRLHGRDVLGDDAVDEPVELLTGTLRSVLLDQRQRIRGALTREAA